MSSVPERLSCSGVPLSPRQRSLCQKTSFLLPSVQDGARLAVSECHNQFRHERWNCSTGQSPPAFGQELTSGECSGSGSGSGSGPDARPSLPLQEPRRRPSSTR